MKNLLGKKVVILAIILAFSISAGVITIIGCGGDGDGDDPLPPTGYVRVYNNLYCSDGTAFSYKLSIGGKEIWADSGSWSGCAGFPPGSYPAKGFFGACGYNLHADFSVDIVQDCTMEKTVYIADNGNIMIGGGNECPGNCPDAKAGSTDASTEPGYDADNMENLLEIPIEGLDPHQFMNAD